MKPFFTLKPSPQAAMTISKPIRKILAVIFLLSLPTLAQAWWNPDWKQRTEILINTTAAGVETKESISGLAVPVRLHSGNFDFLGAKQDGADLRLVAGDDKTPLKFWVERWDNVNELAVVWVQVPNIIPGTDKNVIYAYAGNEAAIAEPVDAAGVFDSNTAAVFHFNEADGIFGDQTGKIKTAAAAAIESNGLIGPSARLSGTALAWPAAEKLRFPENGPFSLSLWVRPDAAQGTLYDQRGLRLLVDSGRLSAQLGALVVPAGGIASATWSQITLTLGAGKLTVYINGVQSGQGDLAVPGVAIDGEVRIGEGYTGLVDEVELASTLRSSDWIKLSYASLSADAKLIATRTETDESAEASEGGNSNFGILFRSLTVDGWVVIGLLGVMFVIALWVMVTKTMFVNRTQSANSYFLERFRAVHDVMRLDGDLASPVTNGSSAVAGAYVGSSIYRLYEAGHRELLKRNIGSSDKLLSGASIDAVKASIDADMVRESNKLNSGMVMLTIAIAGGPFLGLLGTVVGVMITFAAIAAAGDVNVNAIAPGIAAALLATVAGLAVAIPALFGYNYLASRIKVISSEMQIFVDEFVTRVAEMYGTR